MMRWRFALISFVGAIALAVWGYQEAKLMAGANATPEDISLHDLIKRGADGNRHVRVKDYQLSESYVCEYDEKNTEYWNKVWIPLLLPEDEDGKVTEFKALVVTSSVHNLQQLNSFEAQHAKVPLPGLVVNQVNDLGHDERGEFLKVFPKTDFQKCLVIHEGRQPSDIMTLVMMFGGSAALILLAGAILVLGRK
jgi:hypothetical protein